MTLILISLTVATALYIISDTDAIDSYLDLFRKRGTDLLMNELPFWSRMGMKYPDNFFVKLGSCPICLAVWLAVGLNLVSMRFSLLDWGASIFLSWVFYIVFKILVACNNKLNE
jgi:hypothetical protein